MDVDRDSDQDALVVEPGGTLRLLLNQGTGSFADQTEAWGLAGQSGVAQALIGDLDQDGGQDLVLAGPGGLRVFARRGAGFVEDTEATGLLDLAPVTWAAWVDANGDRRPDLHLQVAGIHRVFQNDGTGLFEEIELGLVVEATPGIPQWRTTEVEGEEPAEDRGERASREARRNAARRGDQVPTDVSPPGDQELGSGSCASSLEDMAGGECLTASTIPTLGMLYPLGNEFYIDSSTGYVGVGTTNPAYSLQVSGQIVSGTENSASGLESAVGGGKHNSAAGEDATVAGGDSNIAGGSDSTVGGGFSNYAFDEGATVAGGIGNRAGKRAFVGGGSSNEAQGSESVVSGGRNNETGQPRSFIGGGEGNASSGHYSVITGGRGNRAGGALSTVPGGEDNSADGDYSMAAGRGAQALHRGTYVWADSGDTDFVSSGDDQFLIRAEGGVGIGRAPEAGYQVDVDGAVRTNDRFISSKPSGAPFEVLSTDVNPNLNADLLDGYEAADFSRFGNSVDSTELEEGAVTGSKVAAGALEDAHLAPDAAISGTKILPDFGSQDMVTHGGVSAGGVIESSEGGFRFPDGTLQSTAQVQGPQGAQGPQGPAGPQGPQGPPGIVGPIEPTESLGTMTLNLEGHEIGPFTVYAFGQERAQATLPHMTSSETVPPTFRITRAVDEDTIALHEFISRNPEGNQGSVEITIDLDHSGSALTILGTGLLQVKGLVQREFDSLEEQPREDLALSCSAVTWTLVNNDDSFSAEWSSSQGWSVQSPLEGPLTYSVCGDIPAHSLPEGPACETGDFRLGLDDGRRPWREFEIVKPVDRFTVGILSATDLSAPQLVGECLPLGLQYMGPDSNHGFEPRLGYRFDEARIKEWRLETDGERVQEVILFRNEIHNGTGGGGSAWHAGGAESVWASPGGDA